MSVYSTGCMYSAFTRPAAARKLADEGITTLEGMCLSIEYFVNGTKHMFMSICR